MPNRTSLEIILVINIAYEWIRLMLVRCVGQFIQTFVNGNRGFMILISMTTSTKTSVSVDESEIYSSK